MKKKLIVTMLFVSILFSNGSMIKAQTDTTKTVATDREIKELTSEYFSNKKSSNVYVDKQENCSIKKKWN